MANLLYAQEHLNCPNYDNRQHPAIEEVFLEKDSVWKVYPWVNKIMFVLEGKMLYSTGQGGTHSILKGQALFLPANRSLSCNIPVSSRIGIVRLYDKIQLCDCFRPEDHLSMKSGKKMNKGKTHEQAGDDHHSLLDVNPVMEKYLEILTICYRAGLRCRYYNEGKVRELMFIFRAFYTREDLARFFAPALTTDTFFSQFVMSNYSKYKNLKELAQATNYTVSGFEKKFRRVFGCSPYSWMRQQRAQEAYHQINTSNLSLSQISDMFGFNSYPAFIKFIRQHFGVTPRQIRGYGRKAE